MRAAKAVAAEEIVLKKMFLEVEDSTWPAEEMVGLR